MNPKRIYVASGWFTEATEKSLTDLENLVKSKPSKISAYMPRHDGVKLSANEFHDHSLRKKVFLENVYNIKNSDIILVNLDSTDGFYDTGTCWELGYAMSEGLPVVAYDPVGDSKYKFKGIMEYFLGFFTDIRQLSNFLDNLDLLVKEGTFRKVSKTPSDKLLFVGPDTSTQQIANNEEILASVVLESHGSNFRSLTDLSRPDIYSNIDNIFNSIHYMVAVIDDRHPIVSWMMGQAYSRNVPIVSFTNFDYGVNIMLSVSVLTHCKGKDELRRTIQKIKREGIDSFGEYDTSSLKAY